MTILCAGRAAGVRQDVADVLHDEAPVHLYRDRVHARISAQIDNEIADVDRLAEAVPGHVA